MTVEVDTETTGLQAYAPDAHAFLVQFLHPGEDAAVVLPTAQNRDEIQGRLDCCEAEGGLRAWNTKFDLAWLKMEGFRLPPESCWEDGMVLAHVCDERVPNALAIRHEKLFGAGAREDEKAVKGWLGQETKDRRKAAKDAGEELVRPNYSDVPDEIMHPYAAGDVVQTREVCEVYEKRIASNDELRDVYELERKVLAALFWCEDRGVPIDREAAVRYEAQLVNDLDRLHGEAVALAGIPHFNPGSNAQLAEALERRGADLTFVTKTPTGKLSMDEENLSAVDDPLAAKIRELRDVGKMYGTYIKPMLHPVERGGIERAPFITSDNRIHPSFNQVGARTGRMSSSDPNFQNWHRTNLALRHLVLAGPGKVIITADLDAIEARVLAAYAPGGALKEIVLSGADLHTHTAKGIGLRDRPRSDGSVESARDRAKVFLYSVMYGAGVRSLRKQFGASQTECREMLKRFHATYPEIAELQNRIEFSLVDEGFIKTAWGRRMRPEGSTNWEIERESYKYLNYLIQGTAADLMKESCVAAHAAGLPIIGPVHDEILIEVDEADAEEAGRELVRCLTDHPRLDQTVPLSAEACIVKRWSHAKDPNYVPPYE